MLFITLLNNIEKFKCFVCKILNETGLIVKIGIFAERLRKKNKPISCVHEVALKYAR